MKRLWAPWRMKYVTKNRPAVACVFCEAVKREDGPQNLVLFRDELAFVILNRFPYTSGHLMVVPYVHQPSYEQLDVKTRSQIMELMTRATSVLRRVYHPEAFNVGANIGAAAGAGIAAHVHFHIVPRWGGDANFMSAVGETRVLPEGLEETYSRLAAAWNL